jgi:CheY-like chemotaxis protein
MPQDVERAKSAGFDAYITKPFRIGALLKQLEDWQSAIVKKREQI